MGNATKPLVSVYRQVVAVTRRRPKVWHIELDCGHAFEGAFPLQGLSEPMDNCPECVRRAEEVVSRG